MFRKSKGKIVASIMGALVLLFAVTLLSIILTEYYESQQESDEMLTRYVEIYSLDRLPGSDDEDRLAFDGGQETPGVLPPVSDGGPEEEPLFQLSTFYSVLYSADGEVLHVDTGQNGLYSVPELTGIADGILETGNSAGRYETLKFQVADKDGCTLVAFIDDTVSSDAFTSLIWHMLIAGGIAFVLLFFMAILLAHWIVKPLEENDRRQKQFVSDAGHELKTPVSVISTNAELLSRQVGPNEWLDNICYENERMGDLVTQLLTLSRAENAQVQMEEIDFSRLVTGEALPFESVAFEKGLMIESGITEDIRVEGNRSQLSQLVSILLDNAIRHSDGGKEIGLTLTCQGRNAVLTVVNSGEEISPKEQEHLFDRFYRVDDVRNSESSHYGLGLAIARAITQAHGGRIAVSCQEGKVTFTVSIPVKKI